MSKPDRIHTSKNFYSMKAKDVKVDDAISLGRSVKVISNTKNHNGARRILCSTFGDSSQTVTLILPSKFKLHVIRRKTEFPKKNK